jgi:hypothetical protein
LPGSSAASSSQRETPHQERHDQCECREPNGGQRNPEGVASAAIGHVVQTTVPLGARKLEFTEKGNGARQRPVSVPLAQPIRKDTRYGQAFRVYHTIPRRLRGDHQSHSRGNGKRQAMGKAVAAGGRQRWQTAIASDQCHDGQTHRGINVALLWSRLATMDDDIEKRLPHGAPI